jgi:hypothetical protein
MKDIECPYCGHDQDIDHDDGQGYEEDKIHEQECEVCFKSFAFNTTMSYSYDAWEAECLNGGQHNMAPVIHGPRLWPDWVRCTKCGHDEKGAIDRELLK